MSNLKSKRFLAMVLTLVMVFSTFATMGVAAAGSAGFVDVTINTQEMDTALNVLRDLGIVRGVTDTEFDGARPVTRAEFALFVARISTGRPGDFAPSTAALPFVRTMFSDLDNFDNDGTFAAAIQYGVENGIIQGFPDGTFRPNNPILFEEAVTMLTRALGYTGLSFPHGYLSRANERGVRLIGPFVLTRGFDFGTADSTGIGEVVYRYDMAMLLYNFLLTDFNRLVSLWSGVLGRYEMVERRVPVLTNFGITPVIAYVTGVENYAIDLRIGDYHPNLGGEHVGTPGPAGQVETLRPARFTGTPISPTLVPGNPGIRTPHDIEIMHGTTFVGGTAGTAGGINLVWNAEQGVFEIVQTGPTGATAGQWATQRVVTTKEALGLADRVNEDIPDFMAARSWLGIRIILYTRTAGAHRDVILPNAVVLGTRTLADNSLNDATFTSRVQNVGTGGDTLWQPRVYNVQSLTLDTGTEDGVITFNQSAPERVENEQRLGSSSWDLQRDQIYTWRRDGILVSGNIEPRTTGANINIDPVLIGTGTRVRYTGRSGLALHEISIDRQLAAMIANDGNYELWAVDNGYNRLGEREIFFEFVPFRVGYRIENYTGGQHQVRFRDMAFTGDGRANYLNLGYLNRTPIPGVALIAAPGVDSIAHNHAYLFTTFGRYTENVVFREQLVPIAADVTIAGLTRPISYTGSSTDRNSISNVHVVNRGIFTFDRATGARAIGAIYSDTAVNRFAFGYGPDSTFTLFGRADDIAGGTDNPVLLVRRTHGGTPPVGRGDMRYVVVTSTAPGVGQTPGTNASPTTQNLGGIGTIFGGVATLVEVFDPIVGTNVPMWLTSGNMGVDAALANIRPGEYLAVRPNRGAQTWTWAPVTATPNFVQASLLGHLDSNPPASPTGLAQIPGALTAGGGQATVRPDAFAFEWNSPGTTPAAVMAAARPVLNAANNSLPLPGSATIAGAGNDTTTFLTANTRIIVFGTTGGWDRPSNEWRGAWTAQSFLFGTTNAAHVNMFLSQAYRVAVVTNLGAINATSAEVVFISTLAPVGMPVQQLAGHYAIVTSQHPELTVIGQMPGVTGNVPVQFNIWQVRVMGQDPIHVAIPLGTDVRRGQLVRISANAHPLNTVGGAQESFRIIEGVVDNFVSNAHGPTPNVNLNQFFGVPAATTLNTLFGPAMGSANAGRNNLMSLMRNSVTLAAMNASAINPFEGTATMAPPNVAYNIARVAGSVTSFSDGVLVVGGHAIPFTNVSGSLPVIEFYNTNEVRFGSMSIHNPTMGGRLWRTYQNVAQEDDRGAYASNLNAVVWYETATNTPVAIVLIRARDRVNLVNP